MQQMCTYFNETVNDVDDCEQTQLYNAVWEANIDAIVFLLCQRGIAVDRLCRASIQEAARDAYLTWEGDDDDQLYETTLNLAERGAQIAREWEREDEPTWNRIVDLLTWAGGTAREI